MDYLLAQVPSKFSAITYTTVIFLQQIFCIYSFFILVDMLMIQKL